jgi:pheromone a factor receptor
LFSYLAAQGGKLSEVEAAVFLRQILKAMEYLHENDIVHRDLKPDNILMTTPNNTARLIISDFGTGTRLKSSNDHQPIAKSRMFTQVGTLEYVAP